MAVDLVNMFKIFSFELKRWGGVGYMKSMWRPVSTGDTLAGPGAGIVASFLVPRGTDFVLCGICCSPGWCGRLFLGWWNIQLLFVEISLLFMFGQGC